MQQPGNTVDTGAVTGAPRWPLIIVPAVVVLLALLVAGVLRWSGEHAAPADTGLPTITNSIGMTMVLVPGGRFVMGGERDDEQPVREVEVSPFYLATYEVTQAQWEALMDTNPSAFRNPQRPVDQVTWLAAQAFIQALNRREGTQKYRLPSEAEWEYAARAGTQSRWFFGNDENPLSRFAWYGKGGDLGTQLVGRGKPNAWGFYDMYGNVWEWVQDCYHEDYRGAPLTAQAWQGGDCSLRMLRGGGWNSPAAYARSAVRGSYAPHLDDVANGLRVARTP